MIRDAAGMSRKARNDKNRKISLFSPFDVVVDSAYSVISVKFAVQPVFFLCLCYRFAPRNNVFGESVQ